MMYETYGYHCGNTSPANYTDLNIFGLELEIDNYSEERASILDNAVDCNILTVPINQDVTENLKIIQNDSSVWKEIVFRADTIPNLLKRVETLNDYGFTPDNFNNSRGTSCHIHINRDYIYNRDISTSNLTKMFEFFSPVIYAISGRDPRTFQRWSQPTAEIKYSLVDWKERGKLIGNMDIYSDDRYYLVNLTRSSTIELRGFSNYFNFDYEIIKLYFDFIEFIIDECEYMKGRLYKNEGETLKEHFIEWCPQWAYEFFNLHLLFLKDVSLHHLESLEPNRYLLAELERAKRGYRNPAEFVQFISHYDDLKKIIGYKLTITDRGVKNASTKIINKLTNNQGTYFNIYRENKQVLESWGDQV